MVQGEYNTMQQEKWYAPPSYRNLSRGVKEFPICSTKMFSFKSITKHHKTLWQVTNSQSDSIRIKPWAPVEGKAPTGHQMKFLLSVIWTSGMKICDYARFSAKTAYLYSAHMTQIFLVTGPFL